MNLNQRQKSIFLLAILIICIMGIFFEISYFKNNHNIKSNSMDNIISVEESTVDKSLVNINIAKKNLQVKEEDNPTILFGSDYQREDRHENAYNLFKKAKDINPNLIVMCGDYQVDSYEKIYKTENGIKELSSIMNHFYDDSIPKLFVQGNHDSMNAHYIASDGLYQSNMYNIYVINWASFPGYNNQADIAIKTSEKLKMDLQSLINKGVKTPVFIAAHVPLHYSYRNHGVSNKYASYIVDVLNEYGNKLDIVYLFGHNHSGNYDDYIGGSINYIPVGSKIYMGGSNIETNINFTYMNAGYIGYTNNSVTENSERETSLSTITLYNDYMLIQKYTKYGKYYNEPIMIKLKNK